MLECQLQYDDFSVQVITTDGSLLAWLDEFLSPSFTITTVHNPAWVITVRTREEHSAGIPQMPAGQALQEIDCFTRDGHFVRLPAWEEHPGIWIAYDDHCRCSYRVARRERTVEILCEGDKQQTRRALARMIRELTTVHCLQRGDLPVHGAAYAHDGTAYVVAGPRRVGKSTWLTSELLQGDTEFIANDRVMLQRHNGAVIARGMPTVIKIRPKTVAMFPRLVQMHVERSYHREFLLEEPQPQSDTPTQDSSLKLSRAQFSEMTGCASAGSRPLRSLLFPTISETVDTTRMQRLSTVEAYKLLSNSLFLSSTSSRLSALVCAPAECELDMMHLSYICVEIIRATNCYRVLVARRAYEDGIDHAADVRAA